MGPTKVDILVVGAGPAGAAAARGLAAAGADVLLVDKSAFPRWKVCGCCLNRAALAALEEMALGSLPARLGAQRLTMVRISTRGRAVELPLPGGAALSRESLDAALLAEAMEAGAAVRTNTTARWLSDSPDGVDVSLKQNDAASTVRARVVIAADGLAAGFTRGIPGVRSVAAGHARIGAGTTVDVAPNLYARSVVYMAVASGGYVGLVRLEDDRLNVAAAFDPGFVRAAGGLSNAAGHVLRENDLPAVEEICAPRWQGTPPLTRRHQPPPCPRLFLIGDAAEYVEPFTGEGIAWALTAGNAVVPFAVAMLEVSGPGAGARVGGEWRRQAQSLLGRRMRRCGWIAAALRRPRLMGSGARLLNACPELGRPYLGRLKGLSLDRG